MPQITVIVPVYKVEPYLRRCVDSILRQTFTDFDLVLIDDGSPDRCGEICDEYAKSDERVTVIHHEKNLGLSAARNSGIDWAFKGSDSQWLSFIDSDDWVHPLYLEALYTAVQGHKISICYRSITHGTELPLVSAYTITYLKPEDYYLTYMGNSTVAWAKLYAKELFQDIRYPIGKLHEDEFVTYKILFQIPVIAFIPEMLYVHYLNPNGIMMSQWTYKNLDVLEAFEEQMVFFKSNRYLLLAEDRFHAILRIIKTSQKRLISSNNLSCGLILQNSTKLYRQLLRAIIRYCVTK